MPEKRSLSVRVAWSWTGFSIWSLKKKRNECMKCWKGCVCEWVSSCKTKLMCGGTFGYLDHHQNVGKTLNPEVRVNMVDNCNYFLLKQSLKNDLRYIDSPNRHIFFSWHVSHQERAGFILPQASGDDLWKTTERTWGKNSWGVWRDIDVKAGRFVIGFLWYKIKYNSIKYNL